MYNLFHYLNGIKGYNNLINKRQVKWNYILVSDPDFSVSDRSVDGFKGGEEDIILIFTVRSNESGKVMFSFQETQQMLFGLVQGNVTHTCLGHSLVFFPRYKYGYF